ncbi:MAG: 3,4-dihydroxy-2-butanone-4-phosphate synthase [Alphaproteobacteria bacterium]|nr:MAG: 3,4-dihydroxy-2-butanone-4-phosphate synthase [Alphaproteobacteria bacterium]
MSDAATQAIAPPEEIIAEAQAGRMFILVDDEDRENEGDLIIAAEKADAEAINFMAMHGRGLICLALSQQRVRELELPLMTRHNQTRHETAFTISIEAREGVTTGISAADRARTIAVAIDPAKTKYDLVSPGHVFPLVAREGGVLVRAGHTEAAVDVARLAGLNPAGVICEIMRDDGAMARLPELFAFAARHGLKLGTIRDLIAYRLRRDQLVEMVAEQPFKSLYGGEWRLRSYINHAEEIEHVALIKGDIRRDRPTLVRMHAVNIFEDMLGLDSPRRRQLQRSMNLIGKAGEGVIVLIRDAHPYSVLSQIERFQGKKPASDRQLRDIGVGAQILRDIGVGNLILLSNTQASVVAVEGYDLNIVEVRPIPPD